MLEKEGQVLVLGGQPEASRSMSLGRKLKILWAGRQGFLVQGPPSAHRSERVTWGCEEKEARQCLYKVQDTGCTPSPPCPPPTEKGGAAVSQASLRAYSVAGMC